VTTDALLTTLVVMVSVLLLLAIAVTAGLVVWVWRRRRGRARPSSSPASSTNNASPIGEAGEPWEFRTVSSQRVTLDVLQPSDFEDLYAMESDPRRFRYELEEPPSRDEIAEKLRRGLTATRLRDPGDYIYPAIRDSSGNFLGTLYLKVHGDTPDRAVEAGIALTRPAQRQGYALEALELLFDLAFAKFRVHRVLAELDLRNIASTRLCEQLGMRKEAHFLQDRWVKGAWIDTGCYAILEHEWTPRHLSS